MNHMIPFHGWIPSNRTLKHSLASIKTFDREFKFFLNSNSLICRIMGIQQIAYKKMDEIEGSFLNGV